MVLFGIRWPEVIGFPVYNAMKMSLEGRRTVVKQEEKNDAAPSEWRDRDQYVP